MAALRRKFYTRPIPDDAVRIMHKGKPAARYKGRDGKPVVALLNDEGTRCRVRSDCWVGRYEDADGKLCEVSLSSDRAASEMMLNDLLKKVEKRKAGLIDDYSEHRNRPLAEHIEAYRRHHAELGNTPRQAAQATRRCEKVFASCGFLRLSDLNSELASGWLTSQRGKARNKGGIGARTFNHYATSLKAFGSWAVKTRRVQDNPFQFLAKINNEVDVRHERRPLTDEEFARLIVAATMGKPFRKLAGPDRAALYFTAAATGIRASELASLTRVSFDLNGYPPTVTVAAAYSKHRREDVVPLHAELIAYLVPWFHGKPLDAPLWPGKWAVNNEAGDLIRRDLANARTTWIGEASSDRERDERTVSDFLTYRDSAGRVADFHSLRHRFITELVKAGVHPKDAKELARHSTITLTMDRYAHVGLRDTAAALSKLKLVSPATSPESIGLRATGTNGGSNLPPNLPPACGESWGKSSNDEKTSDLPAVAGKIESKQENKAFTGEKVSSTEVHPTGVEPVTFGFVVSCPRCICLEIMAFLRFGIEEKCTKWYTSHGFGASKVQRVEHGPSGEGLVPRTDRLVDVEGRRRPDETRAGAERRDAPAARRREVRRTA